MAEITVKSIRIIKEGEQSNRTPYTWVSVMADDGSDKGTEYTTFDKSALKLGPGSIIDIGKVETKDGKLSFKKIVKVISEVKAIEAATSLGPNGKPEMTNEMWEAKAKIERDSIEAQTRAERITELWIAGKLAEADPLVTNLRAWLSNLGSPEPEKNAESPAPTGSQIEDGSTRQAISKGHFENAGQFMAAVSKEFDMKSSDVSTRFSVNSPHEIKDFDAAWRELVGDKPAEGY